MIISPFIGKKNATLLGLLSLMQLSAFAQVSLQPLENNQQILDYISQKRAAGNFFYRNAQVCPLQTLNLPFFDDFAKVDSFYPKCTHWVDNQAFINANYAYLPPTIGTATLDGLNQYGQPHQNNASPAVSSPADTLTSQPINLQGRTANNNVYFSFYAQPQGLGDRPEEGDSLILEFKNRAGDWLHIWSQAGVAPTVSTLTILPFAQQFIFLQDTAFFHPDFQFRFRNLASITGNNDHWNIDYVYLDQNRSPNNSTYPDVAFNGLPVSPIKYYSALPLRHFSDTLFNDTLEMNCQNLSALSGTLDRVYTVRDLNGASLLNAAIPAVTYSPSPNNNDVLGTNFLASFSPFAPVDTTTLLSTYTILNPSDFQNNPLFAANDTVYKQTKINNYFAYDDGTAEARLIAQGIGTQVAVGFRTVLEDTLRGIYFHLPYFTNRNSELDFINIQVWLSSLGNNNQVFSRDIYRLRYVGGFNGFYYFELADFADSLTPVYIPANTDFYVGWQQSSSIPVPVGFDRNNNAEQRTFMYINGSWQNIGIEGAILIRPLLSMSPDYDIVAVDKLPAVSKNGQKTANFGLYPNPANDILHINLHDCIDCNNSPQKIEIYNQLGQLIQSQAYNPQINISNLPNSLYWLRLDYEGGYSSQQPFIKQ